MKSSAYRNWIIFLLAYLLLTLNFLVIKHYLLNKSARPLNLTSYLSQEPADLATPARESIEQILDQICRFVAANVVTANVAAITWFLVGYPSTLVWYETTLVAILAPLFNLGYFHDSGVLLAFSMALHQVFKTAWFAKTSRLLRKLITNTPKHQADHSPYRASALFLTAWLTSHLTRSLSNQATVFGKPVTGATPLNLYVYFGIMFALPVVIRRNLLERHSRKVISLQKMVYV